MSRQFKIVITAPTIPYLSADLYGGFIEVDYAFTSPKNHVAEGDRILQTPFGESSFDPLTNTLLLSTEYDHTSWEVTATAVRYHNNLIEGRIPYSHLCSTDSATFDDYSIEMQKAGEELITFIHSGSTGRPSFTLLSKYIKRKLFGSSTFWSATDKFYDGGADTDTLYDKRIIYGSPGWQLLRSGILSKSGSIYDYNQLVTATPSLKSGGALFGDSNCYDRVMGKLQFVASSVATDYTTYNHRYKIAAVDIGIDIDDFVTTEHDLHGRTGVYLEFLNHTNTLGRHVNFKKHQTNSPHAYNFSFTTTFYADDSANTPSGGTAWSASRYFQALILANYDYYRTSFQSQTDLALGASATSNVLAINPKIPIFFNRFLTDISILSGTEKATNDETVTEILKYGVKFKDNLINNTNWDYHTCFSKGDGTLDTSGDGNCYVRTFYYDQKIYANTSLGGNHIVQSGNPDYAKVTNASYVKEEELLLAPNVFSDAVSYSKMVKDYSFAGVSNLVLNGRIFSVNQNFAEYQNAVLPTTVDTDHYNLAYTGFGAYGSTYHFYRAATHLLPNLDIGKPVALAIVNMPQSLNQAVQADRNAILILAENGYRYINLATGNPQSGPNTTYSGDCCVSKKSVYSSNGIAYCAGRDGVYRFSGQQKENICVLGDSDISLTWKALSDDIKAGSIGVYDTKNSSYLLAIKETYTDYSYINHDGYRIYVFDFEINQIYSYFVEVYGQDLLKMNYINGTLYLFTKGSNNDFFCGTYDNSTTSGSDVGLTTATIIRDAILNPQQLNDRDFYIKSILMDYTLASNTMSITLISDGSSLYPLSLTSGTNVRKDHRINRDYSARCKSFAFRLYSLYDLELMNVGVEATDPIQRKWIKHAES